MAKYLVQPSQMNPFCDSLAGFSEKEKQETFSSLEDHKRNGGSGRSSMMYDVGVGGDLAPSGVAPERAERGGVFDLVARGLSDDGMARRSLFWAVPGDWLVERRLDLRPIAREDSEGLALFGHFSRAPGSSEQDGREGGMPER